MTGRSLWAFLLTMIPLFAVCEGAEDATDAERQMEVSSMVKAVAERCRFSSDTNHPFVQHPEPILRWSNPTAGSVYGDVYVWTDQGRPAVIAGAYRWFSPDWGDTLEVCSVSSGPVLGEKNDVTFWMPDKAGIEFQTLTDVDPPGNIAAARLARMRWIVDDFVVELTDTRGTNGVKRRLRPLSRPVYRYPAPTADSKYVDGALFAFVEGTDPEVFLLVEAAEGNAGPEWRFGVARMNRDELQVTHKNVVVWTVPYLDEVMGRTREPYALFSLRQPGSVK